MKEISENTDLVPFHFEGLRLKEACFINGNPYFTRKAIGEFLEYGRPQEAVDRLIQCNPHLSDPAWSVHVNLTCTDGKEYEVEVYDPVGLQLIIFESKQPKAIQYKIAVAHLVVAFMKGHIRPSRWAVDRVSAIKQILSMPSTYKRSALIQDLAAREAVHPST